MCRCGGLALDCKCAEVEPELVPVVTQLAPRRVGRSRSKIPRRSKGGRRPMLVPGQITAKRASAGDRADNAAAAPRLTMTPTPRVFGARPQGNRATCSFVCSARRRAKTAIEARSAIRAAGLQGYEACGPRLGRPRDRLRLADYDPLEGKHPGIVPSRPDREPA